MLQLSGRATRCTAATIRVAPLVMSASARSASRSVLTRLSFTRSAEIVDQAEVRVHRLEVPRVGFAQVAVERAEHRRRRREHRVLAGEHARQVDAGEQARRRALGVALDAGELAGEQHASDRRAATRCGGSAAGALRYEFR